MPLITENMHTHLNLNFWVRRFYCCNYSVMVSISKRMSNSNINVIYANTELSFSYVGNPPPPPFRTVCKSFEREGFRDFGGTCNDSYPTLRWPLRSMSSETQKRSRTTEQEGHKGQHLLHLLHPSQSCGTRREQGRLLLLGLILRLHQYTSIILVKALDKRRRQNNGIATSCIETSWQSRSAAHRSSSPSSRGRPWEWSALCNKDDTRSPPASSGTSRHRTPSACLRSREKVNHEDFLKLTR